MDTMMKPVQNGCDRRRQWSSEQKLTVLQEWQAGVRWKRSVGSMRGECGADVSLEAQPRPRAQRVWQVGAEESCGRAAEAGRQTRTSLGAEGLVSGCVKKNLRVQRAQIA